ncbi:Crp/Fnr family transcriptional regulator [Chitinivibrio alkaliphilus]|uniref:Putative cyclic nucleotide-binding protein n=1 Tax=Chitinivibrio alkaliphilus ACht1 TaxID=1313304 RepID=U7D7F1_9BACT|nr:cyclic nucleotide-binding domain-containing protein [Chitinivibrio alkaliphilus]ERP38880.1 putative cyclic nucleotide-binding protein [Chitinivibrio alkaliphilus ACht1]
MSREDRFTTRVKKYSKGDIIFNEGNTSDGLYLIKTGRVRVFKRVYTKGRIVEYELAQLGVNNIFGEMALLGECTRTASVRALTSTTCMRISKNVFEQHISKLPHWVHTVIKNLVIRLDETNNRLKTELEK